MNDKRTRSDYLREIEQLKRVNKCYEKTYKELIKFIEDELEDIDRRMKFIEERDKSGGGYTARMYLIQQKKALIKVLKKITVNY